MRVDIYIQNTKLDLFADENVDVNSSVADIEDITKNTTDYTKTFTVPASKENNKLFKHWYNADVDNSFDARIKVDGHINLDGMLFKKGKFRLSKVSMKKSNPSSYTINFWGNLLSLKDTLGKDELSNLDLSAYDHNFTSANVKTGLVSSLFSGDLIYNLLAKKQYYYSSDVTDTTTTETLTNIGWGDGSGSNGVQWDELRPALKLINIIEAIENDYADITFSRDFFGRSEFTSLYLWLNSSRETDVSGETQIIDFDGGNSTYMNLTTNVGSYPDLGWGFWEFRNTITPSVGYESVEWTLVTYVDGSEFSRKTKTGTNTTLTEVYISGSNKEIYQEIESNAEFIYTSSLRQEAIFDGVNVTTTASANTIDSNFLVSENIPKIKTIDFLKGLFKMFKLVVIPENDGSLYVNTFDAFYAEGQIHDISNFVDYESINVTRGKILNEINYLFSEPQTILNQQFEQNTSIAYGDSEVLLKDDNGDVLDGTKLEFTLPFEQILYERLTDQHTNSLSLIQYGAIIDEDLKAVNPKPHIFYNVPTTMGSTPIGFINDAGTKEILSTKINTPSHVNNFINPNFSTVFNSEINTWNGQLITNTLYSNYHENYILSVFNVKKREFNYTAKNLPLRIMLELRLNDFIKIKDRYYRINNFNTNLLTGEVKFNLINSFETIGRRKPTATPSNHIVDSEAQQVSSYVTNLGTATTSKTDLGDGVGWVTVTSSDNTLFFDVDENTTGSPRQLDVEVKTNPIFNINITQLEDEFISFRFHASRNTQYLTLI